MRDYSFGNHLAALRKEKGYSQYRFGRLLGVTDKAVSKWENGVSKPKMEICLKIADLLGIGIDDLLCQRSPDYEEERSAMEKIKKELWEKAEQRLYEVYGKNPPLSFISRLEREKSFLQNNNSIFLFHIMSQLQEVLSEKNSFLIPRGHINGSFTAWLLGSTIINPLPAHTFCPNCRKVEFCQGEVDGWDLFGRKCDCGTELVPDGHNLIFEAAYVFRFNPFLSFDCSIPACLEEEAWNIIMKQVTPLFSLERHTVKNMGNDRLISALLLLHGKEKKEYGSISDVPTISDDQYWSKLNSVPSICLLPDDRLNPENMTRPGKGLPKMDDLLQEKVIKKAGEIHLKEWLRDAPGECNTPPALKYTVPRFSWLVKSIAALHGSYTFETINELTDFLHMPDYMVLPLTREDVWRFVWNYIDHESETGIAAQITTRLSKGLYATRFSEQDEALFRRLRLPDWFESYARHVYHLFPMSHCVGYAYLDLIEAWRSMDEEDGL